MRQPWLKDSSLLRRPEWIHIEQFPFLLSIAESGGAIPDYKKNLFESCDDAGSIY